MTVDYHRPTRLDDALAIAAGGARIAAGCTDLFPLTAAPSLEIGETRPILDITAIPELRRIGWDGDDLVLGAAATWTDVAEWRDAARTDWSTHALDALRQAALQVGGVQIQNAGTIAGNLCTASPAADGAPPLLTLDADVALLSTSGMRRAPLSAFLLGARRADVRAGEVMAEIRLPKTALSGRSRFLKLGARRYLVISIAMVAARLVVEAGRIATAALAIGACSPTAVRTPLVENALRGAPADLSAADLVSPDDVAAALSPISDIRADTEYRIEAAATLARRAVAELLQEGPA